MHLYALWIVQGVGGLYIVCTVYPDYPPTFMGYTSEGVTMRISSFTFCVMETVKHWRTALVCSGYRSTWEWVSAS